MHRVPNCRQSWSAYLLARYLHNAKSDERVDDEPSQKTAVAWIFPARSLHWKNARRRCPLMMQLSRGSMQVMRGLLWSVPRRRR